MRSFLVNTQHDGLAKIVSTLLKLPLILERFYFFLHLITLYHTYYNALHILHNNTCTTLKYMCTDTLSRLELAYHFHNPKRPHGSSATLGGVSDARRSVFLSLVRLSAPKQIRIIQKSIRSHQLPVPVPVPRFFLKVDDPDPCVLFFSLLVVVEDKLYISGEAGAMQ